MSTQPIQNSGFCAQVYETGASGVNWLTNNSKAFASNAGNFFERVWASVSEFFSNAGQTLGSWMNSTKDALFAAKDHFVSLPTNVKVVGGIVAAVATLGGFFLGKACGSETAQAQAPARAAQPERAQEAPPVNQPVENPAQQP